jgi:hypothetical protein
MPRRTNEFQELIAEIQKHLDPGATVEESAMLPDRLTGTSREVDICVRGSLAKQQVVVSIECRDRGRPADVTWVDEMHTKHSRLATDLLVLASHSSFTTEAARVADTYNIRHLALDDIESTATDRLFPDTSSLWGKTWSVAIERVSIIVERPGAGTDAVETVRAHPDTALFLEDGTSVCSSAEMAQGLANLEQLQRQIGSSASPEHKFVQFGWRHLVHEGKRICLKKLDPLEYRPIQQFNVVAKCDVTVNEFPLKHGKYGAVRVAWGTGAMLGSAMMVVATVQGTGETKISLRPVNEKPQRGGLTNS